MLLGMKFGLFWKMYHSVQGLPFFPGPLTLLNTCHYTIFPINKAPNKSSQQILFITYTDFHNHLG